jgi:hypothetical protein
MTKPVAAVVGIGPKNGAAFAHAFHGAGYRVAKQLEPNDIAAAALALTKQPSSAWSFEVDLRPKNEPW